MLQNELTGIERQLVLQYLIDGNVPVTVTEESTAGDDLQQKKRNIESGVFPVALPGEEFTVLEQGIILLKNPPQAVKLFDGKKVRVQFYFNRLGLYFITTVKSVNSGLALVIPAVIKKIEEKKVKKINDFEALLYYSTVKENQFVKCNFLPEYSPFSQPKWSDVEEQKQQIAKTYLEKFVMQCRSDGKLIGNGLFLISVVRFLTQEIEQETRSIKERKNPPSLIYVDDKKVVFACFKEDLEFNEGNEYSLVFSFPILNGPIKERTVYTEIKVEAIYEDDSQTKCCIVCDFFNIKLEDARYLEDKVK